ncbi:MAG: outer membrane protein assembly factor BamD [Pyrinomonadaceae bacterium]
MLRTSAKFTFLLFCILSLTTVGSAQRNVTQVLDPIMEADAKHNLDVARQAFTPLKQAYKQVLLRFEETYAAYPEFTGMDEFLYMAGMSSYYLSENKGKQKVNLKIKREREKYDPGILKDNAVAYLSTVIEKYPDSRFREEAEKALKELRALTWNSPEVLEPPVLKEKRPPGTAGS